MSDKTSTEKIQWLEMIRLRTSVKDVPVAIEAAKALLNDIATNSKDVVQTGLMQDPQGLGDIEAMLVWDRGCSISKTREGYIIAEKFREFGMTNHDLWQAIQGFDNYARKTPRKR